MKINIILRQTLQSPIILKFSALIIGIGLWSLISASHETTLELTVPLCFYNVSDNYTIEAPENIKITLKGTRTRLKILAAEPPVVLLNAGKLKNDATKIILTSDELYLPPDIKLVHYHPLPLIVYQQSKNHKTA